MTLDLRRLFAEPWAGTATIALAAWVRWVPGLPRGFGFRTEITAGDDTRWTVRDTVTFADGRVQVREMACVRLADGRLRLDAPDMPGGTVLTPRDDGFAFAPYVIRTPVLGRLRLPLRCRDDVRLHPDGRLVDELELRLPGGLPVARITITLRRASLG